MLRAAVACAPRPAVGRCSGAAARGLCGGGGRAEALAELAREPAWGADLGRKFAALEAAALAVGVRVPAERLAEIADGAGAAAVLEEIAAGEGGGGEGELAAAEAEVRASELPPNLRLDPVAAALR